jgi:2-polyprenyl-3-methyl-5-hydroxy-6-metoxy-1,4-benzoquinol methylase
MEEINKVFIKKPTDLPQTKEEKSNWQDKNRAWWENNPMRYDWKNKIPVAEFSKEFYEEIDNRFFENAREYLFEEKNSKPFSEFVDFSKLKNEEVLEIGVGNGSHAQLLASSAKKFTGIDLTEYAVKSTSERFKISGLSGNIQRMDAEKIEFLDNGFDFVWSWGVIHHSSNTSQILREINRVLRPNGEIFLMVYYRGWWNYYFSGFLRWLVSGDLFRGYSFSKSFQAHTDGAIARYYTKSEFLKETKGLFEKLAIFTRGPKSDLIIIPNSRLKIFFMKLLPKKINIFFTDKLNMGTFLIYKAKNKK